MVDLDEVAGCFDAQVFDGHPVDLDSHPGFVVGDDINLATDEADLEGAHVVEVDDARLSRVNEPLLKGHGPLRSGSHERSNAI